MNLCSDNHEEICYEDRKCPLCTIRDSLNEEIRDQEREIEELEREVSRLESELEGKE